MNKSVKKDFEKRRQQMMRMMGEDSIAILPASPVRSRNRDVEYPYRPDSDFHYLTGFSEPEAVAVLMPGRDHGEYLLFCRERDPEMETWNGRRAGQEGARAVFHAEDSFPITDIDDILPGLLEKCEKVYYTMGCDPGFDNRLLGWLKIIRQHSRSGARTPDEFVSLDHLLQTHINRLTVLRPRLADDDRAEALATTFSLLGNRYDFKFDFNDASYHCCTEVIYRSLYSRGSIALPLTERMGRLTLSADDVANYHINTKGRCFQFVLLAEEDPDSKHHAARILLGTEGETRLRELMAATREE